MLRSAAWKAIIFFAGVRGYLLALILLLLVPGIVSRAYDIQDGREARLIAAELDKFPSRETSEWVSGSSGAAVAASIEAAASRSFWRLVVLSAAAGAFAWAVAEVFLLRWLRRLAAAATRLGQGRFDDPPKLPVFAGELRVVADALGQAGRRLSARETQLASTERLFRGAFDNSPDVQLVFLADPDGSLRLEYSNPAAAAAFGLAPTDAHGKRIEDALPPKLAARARADIERVMATGDILPCEDELIGAGGLRRTWEIIHVPLKDVRNGRVERIFGVARDITHIRRAEAASSEANLLLRMAESAAHVGHWRVSGFPDGSLFLSEEAFRIHGIEPTTVAPTVATVVETFHVEDRGLVESSIRRAMDDSGYLDFSARLVRPDGDIRSVVVRGYSQTEEGTRSRSLFGVIMDVTELRRVEARLRDNAATLKVTLDNMDQGLMMIDAGGRLRICNQRAQQLLELPPALVASEPLAVEVLAFQRRHGEFEGLPAELAANLERVLEQDEYHVYERTRPNGTVLEIRTVPLPAGGFVRTYADVTGHRRAAEALRNAESRYRLLAENSSDVITRVGLDLRREYVSPACRALLGFEPEEMLGEIPSASMHPDDAPRIREMARQLIAGATASQELVVTYRALHKRGHWIWIEAGMKLVRDEVTGRPASLICSLRDVSERQASTEELRQAKDIAELARATAESASRAKTDFLASMSHEIRTPLNSVIGFADLLANSGRLDADLQRYANLVHSSGSALLTIVNDILDFSEVEAGAIELQSAPFAPAALVDNCLSITRGSAVSKSLEVSAKVDASVPRGLVGDEPRLRQILLNLLTNAIKFTKQGSVILTVRHEGSGLTGERLRFSVTDTGIGIPKDKQHRLFQRFSQIDGSVKRDFGGTGLGLAICKRLIELMGGDIGVYSESGQGATFWFVVTLPRGLVEPPRPVPGNAGRAQKRGRLLLVEDVEINQELAKLVLESAGHSVEIAADGETAIAAVRDNDYDLVLMDVQMPGMDGMTATQEIRRLQSSAQRIPIIAITANVLPEQIREFYEAGMDDHIGKPLNRAELFATIDRWLVDRDTGQATSSSAETEDRHFDRKTYDNLAEFLGAETVARLAGKFHDDLIVRFAEAGDADSARKRFRRDAHAMVAAAGMLGFRALAEACEALCMAADDPDASRLANALATVRARQAEVAEELPRLAAEPVLQIPKGRVVAMN